MTASHFTRLTTEAQAEVHRIADRLAKAYPLVDGILQIPAGDLDSVPTRCRPDELHEAMLDFRAGRRFLAAWGPDFYASWYLGIETPPHQREWLAHLHGNRRSLIEAPRDHGKSWTVSSRDVTWRISMSQTWIGPDGQLALGLRPDLVPPNLRVILSTVNGDKAKDRLNAVRAVLQTNGDLLNDFGPFRIPGGAWHQKALMCARVQTPDADLLAADPTLRAVGMNTGVTGGRGDHLVGDDVEDEASTNTEMLRSKTRAKWANLTELLDDRSVEVGGKVYRFRNTIGVVGTRKHADDLYSRLEKSPVYRVKIYRAFIRWPGGERDRDETKWKAIRTQEPVDPHDPTRGWTTRIDGFEHIAPGAEVLWPGKHDVAELLEKYESNKAEVGSWYFMREQQQFLMDDAHALFAMRFFDRAKAKGRRLPLYRTHTWNEATTSLSRTTFPGREGLGSGMQKFISAPWWEEGRDPERERLLIFQAWDLSLVDESGKLTQRDTDYTLGLTAGLNWQTKSIVLLDAFRARWIGESAKEQAIYGHGDMWQALMVAIEQNAFQSMHIAHLKRDTDLVILPFLTGSKGKKKRDPTGGLPSLSALLETRAGDPQSGRLVLPYSDVPSNEEGRKLVDLIVSEVYGFGTEVHDDAVMCLWILWWLIQRYIDWREGQLRMLQKAWKRKPDDRETVASVGEA